MSHQRSKTSQELGQPVTVFQSHIQSYLSESRLKKLNRDYNREFPTPNPISTGFSNQRAREVLNASRLSYEKVKLASTAEFPSGFKDEAVITERVSEDHADVLDQVVSSFREND